MCSSFWTLLVLKAFLYLLVADGVNAITAALEVILTFFCRIVTPSEISAGFGRILKASVVEPLS